MEHLVTMSGHNKKPFLGDYFCLWISLIDNSSIDLWKLLFFIFLPFFKCGDSNQKVNKIMLRNCQKIKNICQENIGWIIHVRKADVNSTFVNILVEEKSPFSYICCIELWNCWWFWWTCVSWSERSCWWDR